MTKTVTLQERLTAVEDHIRAACAVARKKREAAAKKETK